MLLSPLDLPSQPTQTLGEVGLDLGTLDHYTVCVEDAQSACDFHVNVLGFRFLRTQHINSGTVPAGEIDMLNFVLALPGSPKRTCIITEGLNDQTLFRRFVKQTGGGIHHVAYHVNNIDDKFTRLRARGFTFTSDKVLRDPLSGLRQVFLGRQHVGYFLELIERSEGAPEVGLFTDNNMRNLTQAMESYLVGQSDSTAAASPPPKYPWAIAVRRPAEQVISFLISPANMARWTAHRTIRLIDNRWQEIRAAGDVDFAVLPGPSAGGLVYRWSRGGTETTAELMVTRTADHECRITITMPQLSPARLSRLQPLLQAELRVLQALLEERSGELAAGDLRLLEEAHRDVYLRVEL